MVKNVPSNAGDAGSIPGQGTKIPHSAGQLRSRATTAELMHLNYRAHMPQTTEPTRSGAPVPQLERENPHTTTREKPVHCNKRFRMPQRRSHVLQLRPDTAKNKIKKIKLQKKEEKYFITPLFIPTPSVFLFYIQI